MDHATTMLLRSAAKLLIEAMNHGTLTEEELKRTHAAYRRLVLALRTQKTKR